MITGSTGFRDLLPHVLERKHSERGAVAGLEALMFGVLVILGGLTLIVNAWSALDTRTALDAASREYVRTFTRQPDHVSAALLAERAARESLAARGTRLQDMVIEVDTPNGFGPCSVVTVTMKARVPALRAPFIEGFASLNVSTQASELVDAHREIAADALYSPAQTECFGG